MGKMKKMIWKIVNEGKDPHEEIKSFEQEEFTISLPPVGYRFKEDGKLELDNIFEETRTILLTKNEKDISEDR